MKKLIAPPATLSRSLSGFVIELATEADRDEIYQLRHDVYAREIHQHHVNDSGRLQDALDAANIYIVARHEDQVAGFVSITPPDAPKFSLDKYFVRAELPFKLDARSYEVRLLTVRREFRGRPVAALLMYAALRWVESHGGTRIVGIGRQEVLPMYVESGLEATGMRVTSGSVTYELIHATTERLRASAIRMAGLFEKAKAIAHWRLPMAFRKPASCFHGGAFFEAVGSDFKTLERARQIINADVLDAWFDPAPAVLEGLREHLPWLLRTSPPTSCDGLIRAIAAARGVAEENVLAGSGSSDLIFRALPAWLCAGSRVLLLDPTYGEYAHVLEHVIGCRVDRLTLRREHGYEVPLDALNVALGQAYDLVVLVNPNSPTGRHMPAGALQSMLSTAPATTRVWVDETYVDYAGSEHSLERFAARSANVVVCKSMSKAYALSGARVAYLCAGAPQLEQLRALTPPWVVSLPAQVAAVRALDSATYYKAMWRRTLELRCELAAGLRGLGWEVIDGVANFLLCHLPANAPDAGELVMRCRERGLFLRDASPMGRGLGSKAIRVAVKDAETNARMLETLRECQTGGCA
jgi:histidinol-phosphate/aromatic aminotransferase/cobyric acid decarboxylase-like protein/GNAT superfamily N-acetyltransferase